MTRYIDAHMHLWDRAVGRYRWLDDETGLPAAATLADYRKATVDDPPERFVFVEADVGPADGRAEAAWVHSMCATAPDFGGMVVWAPVDDGPDAVAAHLEALGLPSVVGVRRLLQGEPPGLCTDIDFVAAVRGLSRLDLAFDLCIVPSQLGDALTLARAVPDTRLVLDHFGKPDIAGGGAAAWRGGFEALARLDHVWCKLSGLATEADHARWNVQDLRPYVHTALELFGPARLLWGSDWPVCTKASTHRRWRQSTSELLEDLSPTEAGMILADNAREAYRLMQ